MLAVTGIPLVADNSKASGGSRVEWSRAWSGASDGEEAKRECYSPAMPMRGGIWQWGKMVKGSNGGRR
jgi:hypothetical protein